MDSDMYVPEPADLWLSYIDPTSPNRAPVGTNEYLSDLHPEAPPTRRLSGIGRTFRGPRHRVEHDGFSVEDGLRRGLPCRLARHELPRSAARRRSRD